MDDKETIKLLYQKIDYLEKFIIEFSKLAETKGWSSTDEEMKPIDELSDKLNEVQDKINEANKYIDTK